MQAQVDSSILGQLAKNWWMLAVRGALGILFGIVAIVLPGIALAALILVFGAYAFVDGVFAIGTGMRKDESHARDWSLIVVGIAGVVAGIFALVSPALTAIALLFVIAAWAIVRGVFELIAAWRLRGAGRGIWALAVSGAVSLAFGILIYVSPGAGALAIIFWIGAWSIVMGAALLVMAFRLRGMFQDRAGARSRSMASPAR
jgi:uncharacterized membrane protein HdeD (DUF308 family)